MNAMETNDPIIGQVRQLARFYTLAYADVLDVDFAGSKINMENDLTLAYVSYGEEMAKLRQ
jgi:hypothetical protein